jgi:hypothetical protein
MAITEHEKVVITASVLTGYGKKTKWSTVASNEYDGLVQGKGSTVKVRHIYDVTVGDYSVGTDVQPEQLTDYATLLVLDQAKYISFHVDDTIEGQSEYVAAASRRAGEQLAEVHDAFIASKAVAGGTAMANGVDVTQPGAAFDYLVDMRTALADTSDDLVAVCPSAFVGNLILDARWVPMDLADQVNGTVGRAGGFRIVESNAAPDNVVGLSDRSALASAMGVTSVDRYRPENSFSEAVKSLVVYGSEVIRPEGIVVGTITTPSP